MKNLFSPCVIGKMALKNRFVRSATEDWLGTPDGRITAEKMALYEHWQLAAWVQLLRATPMAGASAWTGGAKAKRHMG